ncbi:hypothetical protein CDO87_14665 [Sagittula sp. P11]|nr:hypothetical protein CDO87_14665 [Sagittula sp. P11]
MSGMAGSQGNRVLRIMLFLSLAANLVVAGVVVAFLWNGPPPPPGRPDGGDPALPYTRALDEDQRDEVRQALRDAFVNDRKEARSVRRDVFADYRQALEVLRAEPYDPAALEALMTAQAERSAGFRKRGQEVLSAYVAEMSPEERGAYADRLEETLARFQERRARHFEGHRRNDGPPQD